MTYVQQKNREAYLIKRDDIRKNKVLERISKGLIVYKATILDVGLGVREIKESMDKAYCDGMLEEEIAAYYSVICRQLDPEAGSIIDWLGD